MSVESPITFFEYQNKPYIQEWDPHGHKVLEGEETLYYHTYPLIKDEDPIFEKYNVSVEDTQYFKSCGLFAEYNHEQNSFNIDFKPFNAKVEKLVNERSAMELGYRAFINAQHALDEGELTSDSNTPIVLTGYTNPRMAKIALKMGFKAKVGGELLTLEDIKDRRLELENSGYPVQAELSQIMEKMRNLETSGLAERLVKRYKPEQYIDEDALDLEDELLLGTSTLNRIRSEI